MDYARYEYFLASSQLGLAMLGMGSLLAPRDFAEVVLRPRGLFVGLGLQLLAVPLLAAVIGRVLAPEPGIAAGLLLVAAVPGGTMSNVVTYLGRGNIALSIALTAITSISALITTPALLRFYVHDLLPVTFSMPVGRVAFEIAVSLLLPLFGGMLLGTLLPRYRQVFSRRCIQGSLLVIGVMVVGSAQSGRLDVAAYAATAPLAILALGISAQATAWLVSWLTGMTLRDGLALAVEVTIRNTNLALLLKASLFPAVAGQVDPIGDGVFFVALLYGGAAIFVAAPSVVLSRKALPDPRPSI